MLVRCLQREFRLCFYHRSSLFNALLFLLVIVSLYPLATSADVNTLQFIGPGVIWVSVLLSMLLSTQHIFRLDYEDGSLDQMLMMSSPLSYYVIAKVSLHWLFLMLSLLLLVPLLGLLYHLTAHTILFLLIGLLLGTPSLMLIGAAMAALTVPMTQNSSLVLLMALPLYVPLLILGTIASNSSVDHWALAAFSFMAAILALAIVCLPKITAMILRLIASHA